MFQDFYLLYMYIYLIVLCLDFSQDGIDQSVSKCLFEEDNKNVIYFQQLSEISSLK